jgi:hypothetical protein
VGQKLIITGAVSLALFIFGVQVYRGHWLHLIAGNIFGDADAQLRQNHRYRRYGIFYMILAVAAWLLWWLPTYD